MLLDYYVDIENICNEALKNVPCDLAFVDPGIFTRADFVNALFGRVDIIVAHDTHDNIYGWPRIMDHPDYEKIDFRAGCGTSFWIKKTKAQLIQDLQQEIERTLQNGSI